jgi:hypothetical protein
MEQLCLDNIRTQPSRPDVQCSWNTLRIQRNPSVQRERNRHFKFWSISLRPFSGEALMAASVNLKCGANNGTSTIVTSLFKITLHYVCGDCLPLSLPQWTLKGITLTAPVIELHYMNYYYMKTYA